MLKLSNILKNKGIANSLSLIVGTGLSQFIPVLASPVLGRLYGPAQFGELAIFMAASVIAGMVATGMFELAIILPKKEIHAVSILFLVLFISFFVFWGSAVILLILQYFREFPGFYMLLPFSIVFSGYTQLFFNWLNRHAKYKMLNFYRISQSIILVALSIIWVQYSKYGLIYGFFCSVVFGGIPVLYLGFKHRKSFRLKGLKVNFIRYRDFPKLILPTSLMNTFGSYGPVFFVKNFYTDAVVGSYSMATRVLTAPSAVISTAIGQVYYKQITDCEKEGKPVDGIFYGTLKFLLACAGIIFLPLFIWGENIAVFILGPQWHEAGKFIEIIALASVGKFVVSPLSTLLLAKRETKKLSRWQLGYFLGTVLFLSAGYFVSIETLLWIFVVHEILQYAYYFLIMKNVVK